jgi:hypothetical protein
VATALRIGSEPVPFPLYGPAGDAFVPRAIAALGRTTASDGGMRLNHVALEHVDRSRPTRKLLVGVIGPLHWAAGGRVASIDPMPVIAAELLDAAGETFASVDTLTERTHAVLGRGFAPIGLELDGHVRRFGSMREGEHWAAVRHIPPVHLLYVIGGGVAPEEVRLQELDDLSDYQR